MEPPVADLSGRRQGDRVGAVAPLRLAAAAAALALGLASSGDALLLAVLLGVAAADGVVFGAAAVVALSTLVRWGSTSMPALAGAQAVLGPAVVTGSDLAVGSSIAAAAALVFAGALAERPRVATAAPAGVWAGLLVAGPAATTSSDLAFRAGGAAGGIVVALLVARWVPRRLALPAAGVAAVASVGLAGVA